MKKSIFESLKFFCAAILCLCLSAFTTPARAALPSGYTELEYIESTGTQYIDTGVTPDGNYTYNITFIRTTPGWIMGSVTSAGTTADFGISASAIRFGTRYVADKDFSSKTTITVNKSWYNINGTQTNWPSTAGMNISNSFYLFWAQNSAAEKGGIIYSMSISDAVGSLVRNFVPAKNSSGKIGMYDTVNNRFYTNAGTGEFIAGPEIPKAICNLFDKNNALLGITVNSQGVFEHNADYNCSNYIPVQNGKTYIRSRNGVAFGVRYHLYDNNKDWLGSQDAQTTGLIEVNNPLAKYVAFAISANFDLSTIQLEQGSTATPYQPYNPSCSCDGTVVNYVSATGTGVQNGIPTPDNPIEPTFYKQGNMVLRKVGDYADTYDATTGKITRRVGVKVLDGTENWIVFAGLRGVYQVAGRFPTDVALIPNEYIGFCSHFSVVAISASISSRILNGQMGWNTSGYLTMKNESYTTVAEFKQFLADQYAAGTPVTIYYPLATAVEEDWTETSYCETPIKIATTKYNETKFSPLNTALANAISVVDSVVTQTISQAASIATLQTQKQTRPADDPTDANNAENCPAGKKCLLVTDPSGIPHWYEIVENAWDLPAGYTQLEYIESTGTQWIDTGISGFNTGNWEIYAKWLLPVATQTYTYANVFSVYSSENHNSYRIITQQTNSGAYYVSGNSKAGGGSVLLTNKAINQIHTATVRNGSVIFDGETIDTPNQGITLPSDANMGIFARGDASGKIIARIYSVNVKKDGVLIGDFVPVKNSSGVVGMYDTVSGQFFTNQGTGEFVAGPVAE